MALHIIVCIESMAVNSNSKIDFSLSTLSDVTINDKIKCSIDL